MSAEAEIRRRIRERGCITFAEFMDLALFWPRGGYYLAGERVGAPGDYYTSPLAHPCFGALLAIQLFQMWQLLGSPTPFTAVELGAGNGLLCRDLVDYCAHLPAPFARSLRYLCLDRRVVHGAQDTLAASSAPPGVARITSAGVPLRGIQGCFLSNEYLDCFPVHRVTLRQGRLQELYVALRGEELAETVGEPSTDELAARLDGLGIALAEAQTIEINLGLDRWAEEVTAALDAGFVLTIDYGHPATELYSAAQRPRGTLTTFYRHTQTDAPLQRIGRQDLTAQVDFSSVANAGRRAGLRALGFTRQRQFLFNLGLAEWQQRLAALGLTHRQLQANRAGMLALARPGGLGDFKVMAQGVNVPTGALWGFEPAAKPALSLIEGAAALAARLPVPLLTDRHLRLLEGRYPYEGLEFELAQRSWPFGDELADAEDKG